MDNTNYDNLPLEIIIEIFKNLSWNQISSASQTCKRWYEASTYYKFCEKLKIKLKRKDLFDESLTGKQLLKSGRFFNGLTLEKLHIDVGHGLIWEKIGDRIEELEFYDCVVSASQFCDILTYLPNLKKLGLVNMEDDTVKPLGETIKKYKDLCGFKMTLENIETFIWAGTVPNLVVPLIELMPNITEYNLFLMDIEKNIKMTPMIKCICKQAHLLKRLYLTLELDSYHQRLLFSLSMNLTHFEFNLSNGLDNFEFMQFMMKQTNLIHLRLACLDMLSGNFWSLFMRLPKLKYLNIGEINELEVRTIDLGLLKNLEVLNLNSIECIPIAPIAKSLAKNRNTVITELRITSVSGFTKSDLDFFYKNMPNLTILELSNYQAMDMTNSNIQLVFKYLEKLTSLKIITTTELADFCFIGYSQGYSISRLKRLTFLHVEGKVNKFTDAAMKEIAKLKNLQSLNLTKYNKITNKGFEEVLKNCTMQSLVLINSDFVNIETIQIIARHAILLKKLEIQTYPLLDKNYLDILAPLMQLTIYDTSGISDVLTSLGDDDIDLD